MTASIVLFIKHSEYTVKLYSKFPDLICFSKVYIWSIVLHHSALFVKSWFWENKVGYRIHLEFWESHNSYCSLFIVLWHTKGWFYFLHFIFHFSRSTEGRPDNQSSTRLLNKPREVKFPWSVYTTSTKSAEELLQSIIHALEVTPGCRYSHDPHLPFLLQCSWAADRPAIKKSDSEAACKDQANTSFSGPLEVPSHGGLLRGDPVHWEMEVCQLPRVHLRGVRLKRIRGSTLHFRPIADLVMKSLRLWYLIRNRCNKYTDSSW